MKKNISIFITVLMLLVTVLTACSPKTPEVDEPTRMTVAISMAPENFDPTSGSLATDRQTSNNIFDPLVRFTAENEIVPCLAESWQDSEDLMSITFKIREDVTFHDGTPLTGEDVVFSINRLMATEAGAVLMNYIGQAELVGEYEVKVPKVYPSVKVLHDFALGGIYIVPKALVEADEAAFDQNPIGTGPYKFVENQPGEGVLLAANENYFGGAPAINEIYLKVIPDPTTQVIALENGEVDLILDVPASDRARIDENPDLALSSTTGFDQYDLSLLKGDAIDDPLVRKAIFHAVNPEDALLTAVDGEGVVAKGLYAENLMGDYAEVVDYSGSYDPALAKDLLEQAEYDPSVPLVITVSNPEAAKVAQSIQNNLTAVGMNVEIEQLEMNTLYDKWIKGELHMMVERMGGPLFGIEDLLNFYTTQGDFMGMNNDLAKTAEFDELFNKVRMETDPELKDQYMREALQMFYERYEIVPLFQPYIVIGYNTRIQNAAANASMYYFFGDYVIEE
jgi:peptide/nickel transport system substrate-binding protein